MKNNDSTSKMRWAPEYEKSIGGEDEKGEKGKKNSSHHLLHLPSRQGNNKLYKLLIHEKSCEARLICYLIIS